MPSVAFYVSGHGFGHASRQIEIINALAPRLPEGYGVVVRTAAAAWLFERTLRVRAAIVHGQCDTGIVQIDSLRLDEEDTVRQAGAFYASFDERAAREAALLRAHDVRLVLADAPPLACAAARAASIPSIVVSNFTWDWIYAAYERRFSSSAPHVLPTIRQAYSQAEAGWRLPMGGGFATVPRVRDLPFVARHATYGRDDVLAALNVSSGRPLALFSFGGYGLSEFDWQRLDCLDEWTVVVTGRAAGGNLPKGVALIDESRMYSAGLRYEDLLAAVDVVVSKPGYGIISECVANDTALLYTSRGRFPEYDVMVREMPDVLRCAYLDQRSLLDGRWRDALNALLTSPTAPQKPRTDGAQAASELIAEVLSSES